MAKTWVKRGNLKGPKGDVGTWFIRNLTLDDRIDALTAPGTYGMLSAAVSTSLGLTALGLPAGAGSVEIPPVGVGVVQRISYLAPISQVWQREKYANGTVWGEPRRTDFRKEQPDGLRNAPASGMKTAAQAVTLGHGGAQVTGSGYARGLIRLPSTASRVRVHIGNRNPRYDLPDDAAVALAAVTLGVHTGAGAQSNVTTIATGASTGTNGYTSPWTDVAAYAGKDVLLGYDYNSAGIIQSNIGTGYGATGTTGAAGTGTAPKLQAMPLFVWLEVEVPASTPVIAAYGDSLACGVGSSNVIYDSPVSQYARTIDAVPVHYAHSGDSMTSWVPTALKWNMYGSTMALTDAVIFGMGSNDVFGGATLDDMKARFAAVMASIRFRISPNVFGATIMPRTSVTGAMETVRRDYNAWLKTNPDLRKVFDFAASISTDDETITAAYDTDGTHLTTAGYAQNAGTLTGIVSGSATAKSVAAMDSRVATVEAVTPKMKATDDYWAEIFLEDKAGRVALGLRYNGTIAGGGLPEITGFDLIVLGGQSDMSGAAKPYSAETFPPHPRVFQYPSTRWAESGQVIPATEPLMGQGPLTTSVGGGPGLLFAREWAIAHPDRAVILVPTACTSTGFNTSAKPTPDPGMAASVGCWQLNKTDEPVNLGKGMVDQAVAAKAAATLAAGPGKTVSVVAFLWSQGLSDGGLSQAQYSTYFDELATGLRTAVAQTDLPVVVGQMSPQGIAKSISGPNIDKAHMDTPRRLTRAAFAYSFLDLANSPADDHLSPRGQAKYAKSMFTALGRAVLNVTGISPVGVEDLAAKRVGNLVKVSWSAPFCRVTGYTVEYSVDGGAFASAGVTRYYDMDTAAQLPASGTAMVVRVTATNEFGASSPVTTEL